MEKSITYFEKSGEENTNKVISLVKDRLKDSDIKYVAIASASGESALKLANALEEVTIINVTHHAGFHNPNQLDITDEMRLKLEDMGVDYICVHTAFDIQSTGHNPLEELKRVNKVITKSKTAVAGGVKLETVDEIVSEGVDVVVVGGAISNASDRVLAAKQIKERLK